MITFASLYNVLHEYRGLINILTIDKAILFIQITSRLKHEILGLQENRSISPQEPPTFLPHIIRGFLSKALQLAPEHVDACWSIFKASCWRSTEDDDPTSRAAQIALFHEHAMTKEVPLAFHYLYPPTHVCTNPLCSQATQRLLYFKQQERRQVNLYTLAEGAVSAYSIHLYCYHCHTNYHPNYTVYGGIRTYYAGLPDYIQVGEHQFIEHKVLELFFSLLLFAWTSASNSARVYGSCLAENAQSRSTANWGYSVTMRTEHVWDGIVLLSLLRWHQRQDKQLQVPHTGEQKGRFNEAMRMRNEEIEKDGQPEWSHYCDRCVRWYPNEGEQEGEHKKVSAIVMDGITIGHPCCGVIHCKEPLQNNQDRFCASHVHQNKICSVIGCEKPRVEDRETCDDVSHQKLEDHHTARDKAMFQLKSKLQRQRVTNPTDSVDPQPTGGEEVDKADIPADPKCKSKEKDKPRLRALFGRRSSHTEQFIFRPCGIIVSHETFYGSETVSQAVAFFKRTFPKPETEPDIWFYDLCCIVYGWLNARKDPLTKRIALPVDVFHFDKKHSKTDEVCKQNCNPYAFKEARTDDGKKWFFNSSRAEQTNVWIGGFHSIFREMARVKYAFVLDELILQRNDYTRAELEQSGIVVGNVPFSFASKS